MYTDINMGNLIIEITNNNDNDSNKTHFHQILLYYTILKINSIMYYVFCLH